MRLSLSVNDRHIARASLERRGWLSAHVHLNEGMDAKDDPSLVWMNAADISEDPNTTHSTWESVELSIGDKVVVEILGDGESDPPENISRTSDSPRNLFGDDENARSLLTAIKTCDTALQLVLDRVATSETPEELKKIRLAIGSVLVELDRELISPTLRRHPALLTEAEALGIR